VQPIAFIAAVMFVAIVLWDAFETIILPRSVSRRFRLARFYLRVTWRAWTAVARRTRGDGRRDKFLSVYGPVSLIGLLCVWATGLIAGFALLQWSVGSRLVTPTGRAGFGDDMYMSGTTFFTLGLGDVHPASATAKLLTVIEGGMGFGFLAIVITYFPVLYQSFSRREVRLTMLDAWAGSPPSAAEILRRLASIGELHALDAFLRDWEQWCSEVLEGVISYPVVAFFRSQHARQSWVSALTTLLDVTSLVVVGIDGVPTWQAHATFAIARHTAVDLTQVLKIAPAYDVDRLPPDALDELRRHLESVGVRLRRSPEADAQLAELRESYEPFVAALSRWLVMPLPAWWRAKNARDNWETSPRRDRTPHL